MKKNALIKGTFILTFAGLLSRFIGFFYRIFLSRMFGEEGMGIYELMNPVLTLSFALCTSGIQSAISKFVASEPEGSGNKNRLRILLTGLVFSGALSSLCAFIVYSNAEFISAFLLNEPRCAPLLRIAALSFPAACIHSCSNGYFYGIKKAGLPAFCQFFEQSFRVGSVFLFWTYTSRHGIVFSINVAAVGLVIGEFASTLVSIPATWLHFVKMGSLSACPATPALTLSRRILLFAAPLSANRVCLHLLGAIESAQTPVSLQQFGYTAKQALSIYGVLTGMAMTCILFPTAITNSVSVLLMPLIAEADSVHNQYAIRTAILKCMRYCFFLGLVCLAAFLVLGNFLGNMLFHSELAGTLIRTLSFLCPFLYLNSTLFSILNGLGKTGYTFLFNILAQLARLAFVFFAVPVFGIKGLLWGMLAGHLFMTVSSFLLLRPYIAKQPCTAKQ